MLQKQTLPSGVRRIERFLVVFSLRFPFACRDMWRLFRANQKLITLCGYINWGLVHEWAHHFLDTTNAINIHMQAFVSFLKKVSPLCNILLELRTSLCVCRLLHWGIQEHQFNELMSYRKLSKEKSCERIAAIEIALPNWSYITLRNIFVGNEPLSRCCYRYTHIYNTEHTYKRLFALAESSIQDKFASVDSWGFARAESWKMNSFDCTKLIYSWIDRYLGFKIISSLLSSIQTEFSYVLRRDGFQVEWHPFTIIRPRRY